jgi:hypothetical protein
MFVFKRFFALSLCLILNIAVSHAAQPTVPPKYFDRQMRNQAPSEVRFSSRLVESRAFVHVKSTEWKACHQGQEPSKIRLFAKGDAPEAIEEFIESELSSRKLGDLEKHGLTEGTVALAPWSGDYWAYASGILGARYMDGKFSALRDWLARFEFIKKQPVSEILERQGQGGVAVLSPAEKYDLIVGDSRQSFANSNWSQGKVYFDENGKVEEWMGICHGWAPAAIVEPRPVKAIEVLSRDQKWTVHLNPAEIKGLVSYSWATNPYQSSFLGERCNEKNPKRNKKGRILNPECFDLNPATWHFAVANLVGEQKRSFVMDATYDYEVWNQPVIGYSYSYFNPQTRAKGKSLEKSTIRREDFKSDAYAQFRSREAQSFVGIAMKVGYVVETTANADEVDSSDRDSIRWVEYRYDLELNAKGEAIGGEWYLESHPDFIWVPKKGSRPASAQDLVLKSQDWGGSVLPDDWMVAAQKSSPRGTILHTITDALLKKASE